MEIMHIISIEGVPSHIYWYTKEANLYFFVVLLATLCQEFHPLITNLISLVYHNVREHRTRMYWVE